MNAIKILMLLLMAPFLSFSQGGVELVPFAGYMFGGTINYVSGEELKFDNSVNYGISVLVPVKKHHDLEFNYTRTDSKAVLITTLGGPTIKVNVATNYFQFGFLSTFKEGKIAKPFGSASLGATWFDVSDEGYQDVWRFSVTFGLGVKLMFSQHFGILLRGRMMVPLILGGTTIWTGSGGSGVTVSSWAAPLQGDLHAGVIIKLGHE